MIKETGGPKHRKENQLLKPGTHLLIILSLLCKFDIMEAHSNLSNPLYWKESPWKETSLDG